MFYDTAHNSTATVLQSLHGAFCETARKMWAYIRCLPRHQQSKVVEFVEAFVNQKIAAH